MRRRRCIQERRRQPDGTTIDLWHIIPVGKGVDQEDT